VSTINSGTLQSIYDRQTRAASSGIGESCLDRHVQLGYPPSVRTESGPTTLEYFARKHLRGEIGTYFPLHLTGGPQNRR
jgi:hypothetical protein